MKKISAKKNELIAGLVLLTTLLLGTASKINIHAIEQNYHRPSAAKITSQDIPIGEILLQDAFNRANANALGAPWVEGNEATTEYINSQGRKVGPGYIELNNNALAFHYNNHSQKGALDNTS